MDSDPRPFEQPDDNHMAIPTRAVTIPRWRHLSARDHGLQFQLAPDVGDPVSAVLSDDGVLTLRRPDPTLWHVRPHRPRLLARALTAHAHVRAVGPPHPMLVVDALGFRCETPNAPGCYCQAATGPTAVTGDDEANFDVHQQSLW